MKKIAWFYIIDTLVIIGGILSAVYFNSLEGYGFMPGFTYIGEFFISLLAAFAGICVMAVVSLIIFIKKSEKNKKSI